MSTSAIPYPEALTILRARARSMVLRHEIVELASSVGRILAEAIVSGETLPTFANSAMDGFAVRSRECVGASPGQPVHLRLRGHLAAGDDVVTNTGDPLECWEIMTGAPFPEGFDACVRIEDAELVREDEDSYLYIRNAVPAQLNRRQIGEDFQEGIEVLPRGHRVRPEDVLILASLGILRMPVVARPRVGVISTGRELVPLEEKPTPGRVRNSSRAFLEAAFRERGCDVRSLGTIADEPEALLALLKTLDHGSLDLIVTTGAISMGKHDFVPFAWKEAGAELFFRKVAMRPGKPILFGRLGSTGPLIVSLPGNPISGAVGLRFFIDPLLREAMGRPIEEPLRLPLETTIRKAPGVTCFYKGRILARVGVSAIRLHEEQRPSLLHPMLSSTHWVRVDGDREEIAEGTLVEVFSFNPQAGD